MLHYVVYQCQRQYMVLIRVSVRRHFAFAGPVGLAPAADVTVRYRVAPPSERC